MDNYGSLWIYYGFLLIVIIIDRHGIYIYLRIFFLMIWRLANEQPLIGFSASTGSRVEPNIYQLRDRCN